MSEFWFGRVGLLALCLFVVCTGRAWAHETRLFVTVEGARLLGRATYGAETPVRSQPVSVFGPDGTSLGDVRTDEAGSFEFVATLRCDHRFVLDTEDGHRAQFVVAAAELPTRLPAGPGTSIEELAPSPTVALDERVERAVARQLRPLRHQLDALRVRTQWRDILGGVGYLFGILGIAAYLRARRLTSSGQR